MIKVIRRQVKKNNATTKRYKKALIRRWQKGGASYQKIAATIERRKMKIKLQQEGGV